MFSGVLNQYTGKHIAVYLDSLPAFLSTPPAVIVDYAVYRTLRRHIDQSSNLDIFPVLRQCGLSLLQPSQILQVGCSWNR